MVPYRLLKAGETQTKRINALAAFQQESVSDKTPRLNGGGSVGSASPADPASTSSPLLYNNVCVPVELMDIGFTGLEGLLHFSAHLFVSHVGQEKKKPLHSR